MKRGVPPTARNARTGRVDAAGGDRRCRGRAGPAEAGASYGYAVMAPLSQPGTCDHAHAGPRSRQRATSERTDRVQVRTAQASWACRASLAVGRRPRCPRRSPPSPAPGRANSARGSGRSSRCSRTLATCTRAIARDRASRPLGGEHQLDPAAVAHTGLALHPAALLAAGWRCGSGDCGTAPPCRRARTSAAAGRAARRASR